MSEQKIPIPAMLYNAAVGGHVTNSQQIIDENLNREQNDINQETVGAVLYNSTTPNGMGRIVLKKNDNFKQVVEAQTNGNTIFVIKYDFTLTGNVTIPANCVLEFNGGSISGAYILTGQDTQIISTNKHIFTGVIIAGTWNCPYITSKWFSDVTSNNRIRQVFNLSNEAVQNNIIIEEGNYIVSVSENAETCIDVKSNSNIVINGNISILANNFTNYQIICISHSSNIHLSGKGHIIGDVETHTGSTGQWGHCLYLFKAVNCTIEGLTFEKGWGDGIEIAGEREETYGSLLHASRNIVINNITCDNNRRQGISVVHAENVCIMNSRFYNTGRIVFQSPGHGIDIEPTASDSWKQSTRNIFIENCEFKNNVGSGLGAMSPNILYNNNNFVRDCVFNGDRIVLDGCSDLHIESCIGISALFIASAIHTDSIKPKLYIEDSEFQYIHFYSSDNSDYVYGCVYANNCIIGKKSQNEVLILKNTYMHKEEVVINDSEIHIGKNIASSSNPLYNTIIKNSKIVQHDTTDNGCIVPGGTFINNEIYVDGIYIAGSADIYAKFMKNYIEHTRDRLFYVYNTPIKLDLRRNIINNETGVLINVNQLLAYLYVEEKIPVSQDNVSSMANKITTLINRVEHFA